MSEPENILTILLADDEAEALEEGFARVFKREGFRLLTEELADRVMSRVASERPAAVLLDVLFPRGGQLEPVGCELVRELKDRYPTLPIIMLSGAIADESKANAADEQALALADFVYAKDSLSGADAKAALYQLIGAVRAAIVRAKEPADLDKRLGFHVGMTPAMKKIAGEIVRFADTDISILITGEPGTGKEELARAIHRLSPRKDGPFKAVNCGQFRNEDLLHSELFGYERGAHSTATRDREGVIESASGGTLFLDEIQALTTATQQALLRTLQFKTIKRVGANDERNVDVRFVSATNADIEKMLKSGELRQDVFDRLSGTTVRLPPLRDRKVDIHFLVQMFISQANREQNRAVPVIEKVSLDVLDKLKSFPWPGNIRALRNAVFRAVALAQSNILLPALFDHLDENSGEVEVAGGAPPTPGASMAEGELTWSALKDMQGELRRNRLLAFIRKIQVETGAVPDGQALAIRLGTSYANLRRVLSNSKIRLRELPDTGGGDD